jgi:iron(III) transport system substrate-binding protein
LRGLIVGLCLCLGGCMPSEGTHAVVVYCSLDREFSEPILNDFSAQTQIRVRAKFDIESTKTVGLVQEIIAEAGRPRCDVFWNNEILNSLRLEDRGLLAVYRSPAGECFPEMYRSPNGTWYGFAGRARVLLVNVKRVSQGERPNSIHDMTDPKWRGKIGLAKPLFGTTATHAACLFAHLGEEKASEFFRQLKENGAQILSGNKQVAMSVASGQIAFGLTDTDDAIIELEKGEPVAIVYPDRHEEQMGTLFIPNTLCIAKNCPHPENAKRLVDYLLSPEVEMRLARAASAQIPLNPQLEAVVRVETPRTVKAMPVDFTAASKQWQTAAKFIRNEFALE